jgi:hypothetical protein
VENLYFLPICRTSKLPAISDNDKKAKILIEKFFPQPVLVNLSNIIGKTLVTRLRVDNDIITEKMARTISRLLNNIVLRPDRIPNEALKTYRPLITP